MEGQEQAAQAVESGGRLPMKNIAQPPELFKVFPLEEQATAGTGTGGGAVKMPAGGGADAGDGGNTFRI